MAIVVTEAEVKAMVPCAVGTSYQLHLDQAALLVSETFAGSGLSDERLTFIQRNLAAHFAAIVEERGGLTKSKQGDAEDTYTTAGMKGGLTMTRFGQQALAMDSSGLLAAASSTGERRYAQLRLV